MGSEEMESIGYKYLKNLSFEIDINGDFYIVVCLWVFLPKSTPFPSTLLYQLEPDNPFLGLDERKRLILSPSLLLVKEANDLSSNVPCVFSETEFPLERWFHLGCEVSSKCTCIHVDGKVVGERLLDSSTMEESICKTLTKLILSAMCKGSEGVDGYIYNAEIFRSPSSINEHRLKDPPLGLCIDRGSASDIESESNGIWNVVGGKVSSRKAFSLDTLLLDAFGETVDKELKIVASLLYSDDLVPVRKSEDDEAPLLVVRDSLEFPSDDKPSISQKGRASFTMKISQLSSNCENKLFRIKFNVPEMGNHPFLEAFTPPIRCISKPADINISTVTWKKLSSGVHLFNRSITPQCSVGLHSELPQKTVCEARANPPSKRVKFGLDASLPVIKAHTSGTRPDEECNSDGVPEKKVQIAPATLDCIQENYGEIDKSASGSESNGARNIELKNMPCNRDLLSDLSIFRYCLGSLSERFFMLKEITSFVSEPDITEIAEKISFFSGCTHHRHQIMIAKTLLEEGRSVWKSISHDSDKVQWDNVVFEIEEHFMRISCCSMRSLTQQDLNFLRRISGGHEYMTKDGFDKMWHWLYAVAYTISRPEINSLWACTSPKWIEGFVTKEEVEFALRSPMGISEPGTFILRFPTTRSWPHPDAGSLVASYVGSDFSLHHRQLSLDYSSGTFKRNQKPLQELILSEPELSQVGRMTRSNLAI